MGIKSQHVSDRTKIIRPLGDMECFQYHAIALRLLGNVIVSARYGLPPSLAAAPEQLREEVVVKLEGALAAVVLEHPALRMKAVDEEAKRPSWATVDSVDFTRHVEWRDVDDRVAQQASDYHGFLGDVLEKRVDEEYTPALDGRPQWRVLCLYAKAGGGNDGQSNGQTEGAAEEGGQESERRTRTRTPFVDVLFEFNHAFVDGISGKIFHESLLQSLNNNNNNSTPVSQDGQPILKNGILTIPPTASTLPPPIERAGKITISPRFAVSTAWKELRPPALASKSASRAHWAPIQTTPFKTQWRMFDVGARELRNVLARCRENGTTLTGLLHAAVVVAMATHIPPERASAFANDTALDMRRHVPGNPRPMVNYVSLMGHKFDTDLVRRIREATAAIDTDAVANDERKNGEDRKQPAPAVVDLLWSCAARVRAEIQHRLDLGFKNEIVGLMHLVSDWRVQHREDALKPRKYSCVVTNLGSFDGDADGKDDQDAWEVQHSTFALSAEVCGAAFQISTISVKDKALSVGCSWQDCVMDLKLGEALVTELEWWLRLLGKD